jgi:hypothetical protein
MECTYIREALSRAADVLRGELLGGGLFLGGRGRCRRRRFNGASASEQIVLIDIIGFNDITNFKGFSFQECGADNFQFHGVLTVLLLADHDHAGGK